MADQTSERDRLIDLFYAVAEDARGWQPALAELTRYLGSHSSHLFLLGPGNQLEFSLNTGVDEGTIADYHNHFQHRDPRLEIASSNLGRVISDVEVLDGHDFERSEIYNDYLKLYDIRYSLFLNLPVEPGVLAPQAFFRSTRNGCFQAEDIRSLEQLVPHLRRSLRLRRLLDAARGESRDLRRALDLMPMPVAILEATGKVLCASERADALLQADNCALLRQQHLTSRDGVEACAIRAAIGATLALADPGGPSSGQRPAVPASVEIRRASGSSIGLIFMPLGPRSGLRTFGHARARMLLVLHDPGAVIRLNPALIAQRLGLTPTEALLSAAIAEGKTLAEFATAQGCSEQTARTHLKRTLDKTGAHRQADLVRLLLGGAVMHLNANR